MKFTDLSPVAKKKGVTEVELLPKTANLWLLKPYQTGVGSQSSDNITFQKNINVK